MAAIYDYTGVVETVCEKQTFSSGFFKQDLVLTDDVGESARFPNHIAFTFKKDNCALLANVQKGQRAKVRFAVDGRAWTDPASGKTRYFTDLTALKLEMLSGDGTSVEPVPAAAEPPADPLASDSENLSDDIPF